MKQAITLGLLALVMSASAHTADDWNVLVSPYIWFAGAEGRLSTIPGSPATTIDVSPEEALQGTEASFMFMFEAKKRRHGFLLDIFYSDVLQEEHPDSAGSLNWKASLKETLVSAGYTYQLYGTPHGVIDIIGGLRYWEVDTRLELASGMGTLEDIDVRNSQSWVDPLVGAKAKFRLGNSPFYLAGFLGVGGASGGSDSYYDLTANIGYQVSDSIVTSVGYRLFDVDYENGSFIYDVKQEGWVLGLVWILGTNQLAR